MLKIPINRITVETLMDKPTFVNEEATVLEVIKKLLQTREGYILVNREKDTVGIISDRDIHRLILKEKGSLPPKLHAKEFMVKPVITIPKTTTLFEAETLMQKNQINRLPVVDSSSSKEVIGIINFETVHSNLLSSFAKSWVKSKL